MASVEAFPHGGTLQSEVVEIEFEMTAGTAGAVPTTFTRSRGIASVTLSTNDYLFVFDETWVAFFAPAISITQATPATTTPKQAVMSAYNSTATGGATCTISPYRPDDGTALHLSTSDVLKITFRMQRLNVMSP
jgi:hypothetical protein